MIFFIDPVIFGIVIIMVIAGLGYTFLSNISAIIVAIYVLFLIFYGIYTIFIGDEDSNISGGIVRILRGLIDITISFYIAILIELGSGRVKFADAKFPLLEFLHMRKFNDDFSTLFLTCGIILIVSIPAWIGKALAKRHGFLSMLSNVIAIMLVLGIYIGGFKLAMYDSYVNSYNYFDYDMEKYEIKQDADVYTEINLLFCSKYFKTDTIQAGSKVYASGWDMERNGVEYYQITDGKGKMGYVSSECMKTLYEEVMVLKKDSILYGFQTEEHTVPPSDTSNGKPFTLRKTWKTDETICTVPAGTVVEFHCFAYDHSNAEYKYSEVVLPDGTEGCVWADDLEILKAPIEE